MKIKINLNPGAKMPQYQTPGSSGCDLTACLESSLTLNPGEFAAIPTGVFLEIPVGFEAQIRARSGLAAKCGVTVLNGVGTIDSDYRGELKAVIINHGKTPFEIKNGDRIAQLVFQRIEQAEFEKAELGETLRGEGGFGSTGK